MKIFFKEALFLGCFVGVVACHGQPLPPSAASTAEVVAGTARNKYVSPYTAAQAGFGVGGAATNVFFDQTQFTLSGGTNLIRIGALLTNVNLGPPLGSNTWFYLDSVATGLDRMPLTIGQNQVIPGNPPFGEPRSNVITTIVHINSTADGTQINTNQPSYNWNIESGWQNLDGFTVTEYHETFNGVYTAVGTNDGWRFHTIDFTRNEDTKAFVSVGERMIVDSIKFDHWRTNSSDAAVLFEMSPTYIGANETIRGIVTAATNPATSGGFIAHGGGFSAKRPNAAGSVDLTVDNTQNYSTLGAGGNLIGKELVILGTFSELQVATNIWAKAKLSVGASAPSYNTRLDVLAGSLYVDAVNSNTRFSGNPANNTTANLIGSDGYWALRTGTAGDFNLDVYNGGTATDAIKVAQTGEVNFHNKANATNTISARVAATTNPGFRSTGTNNMVLTCPDGGSWILRVDNLGILSTTTNTAGL